MKTKYFFIGLITWIFLSTSIFANEVSIQQARKLALNFYFERINITQNVDFQSLLISDEYTIEHNNTPVYYVFNINNQGFIMVAAEDAVYPVLGYSFNSAFTNSNFPIQFSAMLNSFSEQIAHVREFQLAASPMINNAWQHYGSSNFTALSSITSISPLITSIWNQGCYFNDSCPADPGGPCGHVVTGCVATAMAQVINYYEYPTQGVGSHSYVHPTYGTLSANFGATTYNYANMPDTVTGSSPEVARLISHCGVAVEMNYSPSSSGAGFPTNAFMNYFNYKSSAQLISKFLFPDTIWEALLRLELDSASPLFYVGSGSGAHAFVCDGYQSTNHFHFNWGWGGAYDGYFYLSSLNPGSSNFTNDQSAIFGLQPSTGGCSGLSTLIAPNSTFDDGSGQANYSNSSNCLWLIAPPGATSIALSFDSLDLVAGDSIYIFDGANTQGPLIGIFSGNTIPPTLVSSDTAMFIIFNTDTVNTAQGWTITYSASMPGLPCSGLTTMTATTDTISDGSGPLMDYHSYADCRWLIQPPGAQSITLEFSSFYTELNYDFVKVYDGFNTNAPLLGSYSGSLLPSSVTSTGGSMYVHFTSDGALTDSGWTAIYKVCDPVPVISGNPGINICYGDTTFLFVPPIYQNYTWHYNGNPISGSDTNSIMVYDTGTYSVDVMNNCGNMLFATAVYVGYNPPTMANAGNDTSVCLGSCIDLIATGGVIYNWSTGQSTDTINVCPTILSTYYVTVTDSNGCMGYDSVSLSIFPIPTVSLMGYDTVYCPNAPLDTFMGLPPGGIYSGPGMTGGPAFDPYLAGPGNHVITYTYTDTNGCSNFDTAHIMVYQGPPAVITASTAPVLCAGDSVILYANTGTNLLYQWYVNGKMIPGADSSYITSDSSASYVVMVTDSIGCSNYSLPLNLFVNPVPQVYAGDDTTTCFYMPVTLDAGPGFDNYLWSTGAFTQTISVSSTENNTGPKDFSVIVTKSGCVGFDTVTVTFDPCTGISTLEKDLVLTLFPNPNDGKFELYFNNELMGKYNISVYDIFGRLIYMELKDKSGLEVTEEINLTNLRSGYYIITVEFSNAYSVKQFIIR
ncbi:C10 family peptidase [candidate division KSB1 bacterium]